MRILEYRPDFTTVLVIATSGTDASGTIPVPTGITNVIGKPTDTGSLYYISVDGNPVSINYGAAAVFGTNAVIEVGTDLTNPVNIPPGTVVHAICSGGKSGYLSFIRARRC